MTARTLAELEIDRFLARAELIGQLRAHPAWPGWESLLREMRQGMLEELASVTDAGEFRYWQGAAGALGEVLDRVERIVSRADAYRATEEETGVLRPELRSVIGTGVDYDADV